MHPGDGGRSQLKQWQVDPGGLRSQRGLLRLKARDPEWVCLLYSTQL